MNVICEEVKRMLRGKAMLVTVLVGVLIVALQTSWFVRNQRAATNNVYQLVVSSQADDVKNVDFYENSILEGWIGCDIRSVYNEMLFILFPLIAVLPFGLSLYMEWGTGYASQVITRCGRRKYIRAKFIATFLGGGLSITIPLALSLLVSACYLPVIRMAPMALQACISPVYMWGLIYLEHPVLYAVMYTLVDFAFGGIFACIALVISRFFSNWFGVLVFPSVLHYFLYYGIGNIFESLRKYNLAYFINPAQPIGNKSSLFLAVATVSIIVILYFVYYKVNIKRESV